MRAYTHWVNSSTYSDEMYNSTYSRIYASGTPLTYWFIGNADYIIAVCKAGSSYYSGYAGYILNYYAPDDVA